MSQRDFDIILWGATGFTGQRVATQLDARAGDVRWAIAGRNAERLQQVRDSLDSRPEMIIADSRDLDSLNAMAARTRVIATTVGPYSKFGTPLVQACIAQGTDCCDLTGEPHWIRELIDAHHDAAVEAGVRIVNCCGFDSIPSDLGTLVLQQYGLEHLGEPFDEVRFIVWHIDGGFSGGTAASAIAIAEAARDRDVRRVLFAPYSLNPPSMRAGADEEASRPDVAHFDDLDTWTAPFFMETINAKIVRRSNALLGRRFGDFRYSERIRTGDGLSGRLKAEAMSAALKAMPVALGADPVRKLLQKTVLPAPGEGPSDEKIARGGFDIRLFGSHTSTGESATVRVAAHGDPGYGVTATMLAESALCLAKDDLPDAAGILTPATAMGDVLVERLRAAGVRFDVD